MSDIDENNTNQNPETTTMESKVSNESTNNLDMTVSTDTSNKKSKSKKKKVTIAASLIGVVVCGSVAVFAGPKIAEALSNRSKAAPIDRFKSVFTDLAKKAKEKHSNSEESFTFTDEETTIDLNLSLGSYIMSSVPEPYQFVNDLSAKFNIISVDDNVNTNGSISTKSGSLLTLEGYGDAKESEFAFRVPELSDSFIQFSAKDLIGELKDSIPSINPITPDELDLLIADECGFITDSIKEVTLQEDTSVEANGISAKYDQLTTVLSAKEFGQLVYQCTDRLLNENYFKEIMAAAGSEYSIQDTLDDLKDWAEQNTVDVSMDIYLDDDDHLMGVKIVPTKEDESVEIAFLSATDKKTGFTFYAKENNENLFSLDGIYEKSKDSYTGDMTLNVNQNGVSLPVCTINFKDLICINDKFCGTVSFEAPSLMGIGFSADFDIKDHKGTIVLKATMSTAELITLNIAVESKKADSCPTLPSDADIITYKTESDLQNYLQDDNMNKFMKNFKAVTGTDLSSLLQ